MLDCCCWDTGLCMLKRLKANAKLIYERLAVLIKIGVLFALFLGRCLVRWLKFGRSYEKVRRVVFLEFGVRGNITGGDVVINNLIKQVVREQGLDIEVVTPKGQRTRSRGFRRWLFGDLWDINVDLASRLGKRKDTLVIADSQLILGLFPQRSISICHYSFRGYFELAVRNRNFETFLHYAYLSLRQAFGLAESVNVAVSGFQKRYLELEGVKVSKVIGNPVAFVPRRSTPKNGDCIFLGRYDYYGKGFDLLEKLAERGLSVDCFTNEKKAGLLNYLDPIAHNNAIRTIERYRVLVHPSRFETCGMTVLEAMSCGVPVIMADVGVGRTLKREIPEFVVSGYDDRAADEYLRKYLTIIADYEHYTEVSRKYVEEHHSIANFQKEWAGLLTGRGVGKF